MNMTSPTDDDILLMQWRQKQAALQAAKDEEMDLRKKVAARFFPNPSAGTQRYQLGNGYAVKLVHKINYKFDENDKVNTALDAMAATGKEGELLAERLVKWDPRLSVSEYKKLPENLKNIIDTVITTSDGAPTLEIEEPKVK